MGSTAYASEPLHVFKMGKEIPQTKQNFELYNRKICPDEQTHDENSVALDDGVENLVW